MKKELATIAADIIIINMTACKNSRLTRITRMK